VHAVADIDRRRDGGWALQHSPSLPTDPVGRYPLRARNVQKSPAAARKFLRNPTAPPANFCKMTFI
jgi:hypothetical protein